MVGSFDIWIARYRGDRDASGAALAAVWASSPIDCETVLRRRVTEDGLAWGTMDGAVPLDMSDPGDLPLDLIRRELGPDRPVIFHRPAANPAPHHAVEELPFEGPLDDQMGIWPQFSVPAGLAKPLFPNDGRGTFAVLDAGILPGLPERLDASGLKHRCLYAGKTAEDLRDVAPYLVALEPEHPLTRALMTEGAGPMAHWSEDYGMFVVTSSGLDELHTHLRKFTSVEAQDGFSRLYLRFWSGAALNAMARHDRSDTLIADLLGPHEILFRDLSRMGSSAMMRLRAGRRT